MKNIFILLALMVFVSSCVKQQPIAQSELTGIWKLNGYESTNYKVEITPNGYLYWFNYNDIYNRIEEFEIEYDINKNRMKLYCGNSNYAQHVINIYSNRKGRLYFTIPVTSIDFDGNTITNYNTYYKMN